MTSVLMIFVFFVSCFNLVTDAKDPPYGWLSVEGNKLMGTKDGKKQQVALHGNSLFWSTLKGEFWTKETIKQLKCAWNANIVRAPMGVDMFGAGYLISGREAELRKVHEVVWGAIENGIYVLVDWHTENLHRDEAIRFFKNITGTFGKYPNVLYETLNEPVNLSWQVLKNYHRDVALAIREKSQGLIVAGTPTWSSNLLDPSNDRIWGISNLAYTFHYYAAAPLQQHYRDRVQDAYNKGLLVFITEYGTVNYTGDGNVNEWESKTWWDFLDKLKISYVNWAVGNKAEGSAIVVPSAKPWQVWDPNQMTPSGRLVRSRQWSQNNGVKC